MKELQLSKDLNVITAEIQSYKQIAGQSIFEIGRRLKHVKENDLVHGEFGKWLKNVGMHKQQAYRFIKIADEISNSNSTPVLHLGIKALYQLATMPEEQRNHITNKYIGGNRMIKNVLTSKEVANVLDVSASTACKYIKRMNEEMEKQGYFTISGRVPVK